MSELNIIDLVDGNAFESGADGYIVKAGQGQLEYEWRALVAQAEAEGKPWGLYWVIDARYSPESHKAAIKAAFPSGEFGALGLWLDIEKPRRDMTDDQYNALPYRGYKPVDSVWRGVEAYTGVYPGMYFGPASWDLIMSAAPHGLQVFWADACDCWIAHYTSAAAPDMRGAWGFWAMWQWREGPDYNRVDLNWWFDVINSTPVWIRRARSDVQICLTPSLVDHLPLKTPLQQAAEHGWQSAINFGAGFEYVDPDTAKVYGHSRANGITYSENGDWGYLIIDGKTHIPFARRLVDGGELNPNLVDNPDPAPWSILGFDAGNVWMIVTRGQEGSFGFTQMQAAQWCKDHGINEAYLGDSGHSCGMVNAGKVLYSAYNERVPQCVGFQNIMIVGGFTMKGTAIRNANVKNSNTGDVLHVLEPGEYVFGDWSTLKTDLIGFDHYYTVGNVRIPLGAVCKVSKDNLAITSEAEPNAPPPEPVPDPTLVHIISTYSDGTISVDGGPRA